MVVEVEPISILAFVFGMIVLAIVWALSKMKPKDVIPVPLPPPVEPPVEPPTEPPEEPTEPPEEPTEPPEKPPEQPPEKPPPPPDILPGEYSLDDFEMKESTWQRIRLHSYKIGRSCRLDKVNLEIDSSGWAGQNQCLIYMSETEIPTQGDIHWIRRDCGIPGQRPWPINESLDNYPVRTRTGRYIVIAFTNEHEFTSTGKITIA